MKKEYEEKIYAGVLGKILGVYRGRPVEGWSYEKIRETFGEIYTFKNHFTGAPLIVADDDISGTFTFSRALEDSGYDEDLDSERIGESWLDYIIENKTILWWGGLFRSTEHTAYIRLRDGIKAPMSGSMKLNGKTTAEQIGAEIFIDSWALMNPGNPHRAAKMAREAAMVSHDGTAVEAAVFLAAMEAIAFDEKDIFRIIERGKQFIGKNNPGKELIRCVDELIEQCGICHDWREVRDWLEKEHPYAKYGGVCPMVPNHLLVIMALIMGGDDFNKALMIAASSGWDTDCNAGNVGCLNGIRLGLDGIDKNGNDRKRIADRMYVVNSDGGSCVTDAVREAGKCIAAAYRLDKQPYEPGQKRFTFEFPGSIQGFMLYDRNTEEQTMTRVENAFSAEGGSGLLLSYEDLAIGYHASAFTETFPDLTRNENAGGYDLICSPALYSGQTVEALVISHREKNPCLRFFIPHYREDGGIAEWESDPFFIRKGENTVKVKVPDFGGQAILGLGIRLTASEKMSGSILVKYIDWGNTPERFCIGRSSGTSRTGKANALKAFVSSADRFIPQEDGSFLISHAKENGAVTIGTSDWKDYAVSSRITFSRSSGAGLIARARNHRQYYGARINTDSVMIIAREGSQVRVIAEKPFFCDDGAEFDIRFALKEDHLALYIGGELMLNCEDAAFTRGGAGFFVNHGTIIADGFLIERL